MTNHHTQPEDAARPFWTPLRAALTLVVVALLVSFGVSGCNSQDASGEKTGEGGNAPKPTITVKGPNQTSPAGAKANEAPMPATLAASALDTPLKTIDGGKPFKLSDLKGKALIIDLWATWCGPCRASTPELVRLQTEYGARGLEVVGLDIDPETDTPEDVKAFAKDFKINYKLAFADRPLAISLMRGGSIPQTIVVGRDGRILEHFIGFNPVRTPEKLREAVERAIQ